jgi:subfamily B ATP-binding cassette protein MsbA
MKRIKQLLFYLKPYLPFAFFNITCNIIGIFFSVFSLGMLMPFLNILFNKVTPVFSKPAFTLSSQGIMNWMNYYMAWAIKEYGQINALGLVCLVVVLLFIFKNIFRWLAIYFASPLRNGISRDVKNDVFKKLLAMPIGFFSDTKKGEIIARVTNDTVEIESSILNMLESLIKDPLEIIFYLGVMLLMSVKLTLLAFIVLPISGLLIALLAKKLKKQGGKSLVQFGSLMSLLEESFGGIRIIKSFIAEPYMSKKFKQANQALFETNTRFVRIRDLSSPVSEVLGMVAAMIVLYIGGSIVLGNGNVLAPSAFITYMLIFSQMINPAKSLSTSVFTLQKGLAAVDRVNEILSLDEVIVDKDDAVAFDQFQKDIVYNNISFAYNNEPVLRNINLTIPKGKIVALVGSSGSGKSTMVDLLPRFWDTTQGEILLDGIPIKKIKLAHLRAQMGIVSQEAILFNDTIANNIAFGLQQFSNEDIINAAKVANAHDFIITLENGYDTFIGERGSKLSGGQRQRITIARAVLKNPPILILDEATSALDTESEKLVQDALTQLMKNRTSIIVAHRLSTVQHADEIVVLHKGEIAEQGSHDILIQKNGIYKKLVDMQSL